MKARYQDILNKGKIVAARIKPKHENCLAWLSICPYKKDKKDRAYNKTDDKPWLYGIQIFELDKKYDYENFDVGPEYANIFFEKFDCSFEEIEKIASEWLEDINELGYDDLVDLPF